MMSNDLLWLDTASKLAPYGIPRSGLVSIIDPWRDLYGRNILPAGSENFQTGWQVAGGATVTVTGGQPDPDGGNNAYLISNSGGTLDYSMAAVINVMANPHTVFFGVWAKTVTGRPKIGIAPTFLTVTSAWSKLTQTVTKNEIGTPLRIGTLDSIGTSWSVLVYQPQLNISTLYPYSLPAGLPQSLTDYSGHGNTFQLGSTAGSDTNDPAWSGNGLVFAGDDYALSPKLSTFQIEKDWTIYLMGLFNGGGTSKNYLGIAKPTETTVTSICLFNAGVGIMKIRNIDDTQADNASGNLTVSTTLPTLLTLKSVGGNFVLTNTRTKSSVSTPNNRTAKDSRIGIGCRPVATPTGIIDAMSNYGCLVYNRATTQTEDAQAYNGLRRLMNSRGVVI